MAQGIDYFNRGHWLSGVQARVSVGARRRMFELWRDHAGELAGQSVLDVGATPDVERLDSNCMLPWFLETGLSLSLYSPEDVSHLETLFSGARVLASAPGRGIPALDGAYDWVSSSAVIEHTGSAAEQEAFLRECARVARRGLFVTCPNRWHWLEFHTKLPLVHWLPREWHRAVLRRVGLAAWARESHLRLLGASDLAGLAQRALGPHWSWSVRRIWTLGLPSNLVLLATRPPTDDSP